MATAEDIIKEISPFYKKKGGPSAEFNIIYDSPGEGLEPVYFWILDFMRGLFRDRVDKLVDNFASSPGGGHFMELTQRAAVQQQQASKIMGDVNVIIKSILNLLYDLKEFQVRLEPYKELRSKESSVRDAALINLKQRWIDQVDIQKGRGSINMLAQDLNFATLRDAFFAANSVEELKQKKIDLGERVNRILSARLLEFNEWLTRSEVELNKRYTVEKSYLRSQVNALQMYSRWAKPYLIAASKLAMNDYGTKKADLVNAFETMYLQLTLFGASKIKVYDSALTKELPSAFKDIKMKRDYYACSIVNFTYRGIPSRTGQQYSFGGRVEVNIKAYALNQEEIDVLYNKIDKSDIKDSLGLVEGMTTESLEVLQQDIDEFLKEKTPEEKEKEQKSMKKEQDVNPFLALFGFTGKKEKKEEKTKEDIDEEKKAKEKARIEKLAEEGIKSDTYVEKVVRSLAENKAQKSSFGVYDIYKKGHGMLSVPFGDVIFANPADVKVSFMDAFKK